jgi:threonyl-tRNA synthetase
MFHRAILGSFERFIGILIENYSGNLPLWLAPTQVTICSITDEADDYVKEISELLRSKNIRCSSDLRNEKISYKVREHSVSKAPIIIAVGKKEVSDRTVSVRRLGSDDTSVVSLDDFTSSVLQESLAPNK